MEKSLWKIRERNLDRIELAINSCIVEEMTGPPLELNSSSMQSLVEHLRALDQKAAEGGDANWGC